MTPEGWLADPNGMWLLLFHLTNKNLLNQVANNADNWETLAINDPLLEFRSQETQKIGGSFPGIGKNNTLTGTLLAMDLGEVSDIIETFNAITILKIIEKDPVDELQYKNAYTAIRTNLLNAERGRSYTSWLTDARKSIKKEDYRSDVY